MKDLLQKNSSSDKYFYISTPLYYASGDLHIGHTYSTVLADIFASYKKQQSYQVCFLTGIDEHGQKVQNVAQSKDCDEQTWVDEIAHNFKMLWQELDIEYDIFVRTSNRNHEKVVEQVFDKLIQNGYIKPGTYAGYYCEQCEEFIHKTRIKQDTKTCLIHKVSVQFIEEPTYFFLVSKFQPWLENLFSETNLLHLPLKVRREMQTSFLNQQNTSSLKDLSVARQNVAWGVKVPQNANFTVYVWMDALLGYLSGLGYLSNNDHLFRTYWHKNTEKVQVLGKEITRFHSIYWPVLLKCLNLPLPNRLLVHNWILFDNHKMSKSLHNTVQPLQVKKEYSLAGLRFFLAYNIKIESDSKFWFDLLKESYNANLANNIGNLVSRTWSIILKYYDGILPASDNTWQDSHLCKTTVATLNQFQSLMNQYELHAAVDIVLKLGDLANKTIETEKPWILLKQDPNRLLVLMKNLTYLTLIIYFLMRPILKQKSDFVFENCGLNLKEFTFDNISVLQDKITKQFLIKGKQILFIRLQN